MARSRSTYRSGQFDPTYRWLRALSIDEVAPRALDQRYERIDFTADFKVRIRTA